MVWTKLAYLSFSKAFMPTKSGRRWTAAPIGAKYRSILKKEFLKAGVPWEYNRPVRVPTVPNHPFDKPPKEKKNIQQKILRITKIKRALEKQDDLQFKYRQEVANKKRLTGIDFLMASSLGNYLRNK